MLHIIVLFAYLLLNILEKNFLYPKYFEYNIVMKSLLRSLIFITSFLPIDKTNHFKRKILILTSHLIDKTNNVYFLMDKIQNIHFENSNIP